MAGLIIISPKAGDKIDIQQGLPISRTVEDNDNLNSTLSIYLYENGWSQIYLTQSEPGGTVPINDSSYTFQYTSDKPYIPPKKDWAVYLIDQKKTFESGKFEIFNTGMRVTSTISTATATQKGSKKSPSASASAAIMLNSTSTRLPHHTPSASLGRKNELTNDNIATGAMGVFLIGGPILWGLVLVYVQGGLIWI